MFRKNRRFSVVIVFLVGFSTISSANEVQDDYVYEQNEDSPKTTSTTKFPTSASLAVEVLTTIMQILITELNENISVQTTVVPTAHPTIISNGRIYPSFGIDFRNRTDSSDTSTTLSIEEFDFFANESIATNTSEAMMSDEENTTIPTTPTSSTNFSRYRFDFSLITNKKPNVAWFFGNETENGTEFLTGDDFSVINSSNAGQVGNASVPIAIKSTNVAGSNKTIFGGSNLILDILRKVFTMSDDFSENGTLVSTNLTNDQSIISALLDRSNFTQEEFENGTLNFTSESGVTVAPTAKISVPVETIAVPIKSSTTSTLEITSIEPKETSTILTLAFGPQGNSTSAFGHQEISTQQPQGISTQSTQLQEIPTEPAQETKTKPKASNISCSHRVVESLTPEENENIIALFIVTDQVWTAGHEQMVCRVILDDLCHFVKRQRTNCSTIQLVVVGEPKKEKEGMRIFFLAASFGRVLPGSETKLLFDARKQEIQNMFHSNFSNLTCSERKQSENATRSPATSHYEHPLDNPVIATSLIAVVISVFLVALLSLSILVLLQRRRRSRKGEWIVNKSGSGNGNVQTYGWCFENDAYANDGEKRRSIVPPPLVPPPPPPSAQLLDNRRQQLTLPVDFPCFDANEGGAFPAPPPPSMNTFNGNGFHAAPDQSIPPPPPKRKSTSSFVAWQVGAQAEELELVETGKRKQKF